MLINFLTLYLPPSRVKNLKKKSILNWIRLSIFLSAVALYLPSLAELSDCQYEYDADSFDFEPSYKLIDRAIGEDQEVKSFTFVTPTFRWRKISYQIIYLNEDQRADFEIKFFNGKIYRGDRELTCRNFISGCRYIFVIDKSEKIYLAEDKQPKTNMVDVQHIIRHSSFLAGDDVLAAGKMVIRRQSVIYLDNDSGHYRPTGLSNFRALRALDRIGIPTPHRLGFLMRPASLFSSAKFHIAKITDFIQNPLLIPEYFGENLGNNAQIKIRQFLMNILN